MAAIPTQDFSLAPVTIPHEQWNGTTELWHAGISTGQRIYGCALKAQFQTGEYYLLVTDYDTVFEEAITVTLLNLSLKPLRHFTVPRVRYPIPAAPSYWFESLVWQAENYFDLNIQRQDFFFRCWICKPIFPFLRPRFRIRRMPKAAV